MEQWYVIVMVSRTFSYVLDKEKSYALPSSPVIWTSLYGALVYGIYMIGNILHAVVHIIGCGPALDSATSFIYSAVACIREQMSILWRSLTTVSNVRERNAFSGAGRRLIGAASIQTNSSNYEMLPVNDEEAVAVHDEEEDQHL